MSIPLVINGVSYDYPETDDVNWGPEATDWAAAVTSGMLQKAGGLFQLLAEVDFGTSYGIKSLSYKTRTSNVADAGQFRLARADVINWRNQANSGNLSLGVSASNVLQFNGVDIQSSISVSDTSTIDLTLSGTTLSADIVSGSIANSLISASAAIAYSKLALSNSIVNADISSSAAIAYSKLNLTGTIVNADVSGSAAIAYSKLDLAGSIVNADVSASAAIAFSKLAALSSANILVGSAGNVATSVAMSGDITIGNTGVTAIGANKVTLGMMAQIATARFLGRTTASTGDVESLTATQATALLNNMVGDSGSGGTKGLVPAPASGDAAANKFLKADGTWTSPAGAGDVVGPASSTDNGFVKFDGTTGKLIKDSPATIVNADVDAAAAIAYSKLDLAGSIVNTDISASAAIAFSKLASLPSAQILVGSAGNVATAVAVTGDISITNGGVTAYAGTVPLNKGGTGQTTKSAAFDALSPMTTAGDLIYGGASGTGTRLAVGTAVQYLGGGTNPAWTSFPRSQIQVTTPTGFGSTNNKIRIFSVTQVNNGGSDITYATSASAGASFTINTAGIYAISYTDFYSGASSVLGFSLNSAQLTTSVASITAANRLATSGAGNSIAGQVTWVGPLVATDVVRPHTDGVQDGGAATNAFTITKISN